MNILDWVKQILFQRNIVNYTIDMRLFTIEPSSRLRFEQKNDVYFLINAFSSSLVPVNGEIVGFDEALQLNSVTMNTRFYKYQQFEGSIDIVNSDTVNTLYVEFLIASPRL